MSEAHSTDPVRHDFNEVPLEGLVEFRSEFMNSGTGYRLLVIQEAGKHGDGSDIRLYRHEAESLRDYLTKVLT